ncbi:MAG: phosphatase PAP2 family protein [Actinobacteria bacterium]|nr:phosphatase PAP2 family protein [Actinomycetota bacterium]
MVRAIRWSGILFVGFLLVTQQVMSRGPLSDLDATISQARRPNFASWIDFILRRIDDLGLRGFTAVVLLIAAVIISRRFKSWRPLNLAAISLLSLNLFVGVSKLVIGRTKPSLNVDLLYAGGLSYPSGHASNALVTWGVLAYLIYRYSHGEVFHGRLLASIVTGISLSVCAVSLFRDTHWVTDLLGGLFLGGSLLVAIIAIDRYFPSVSQRS